MEFLAFDIECANSYQGRSKICSFGYVLADENFSVIRKEDIIINPKARFHEAMEKKGDIRFAYTKEEFSRAPDFTGVYDQIRELLEAPGRLAVGHSVSNDILYLRDECKRYHLPQLKFDYVDAQALHRVQNKTEHVYSLDKIAAQYGIEFVAHKSDDDAFATLAYFQAVCKEGDGFATLSDRYGIVYGRAEEDTVIPMRMTKVQTNTRCRIIDELIRAEHENVPTSNGPLSGRRICFNLNTERRDCRETVQWIAVVNRLGGIVVPHAKECNTFIVDYDKPCARCRAVEVHKSQGAHIEYWTEKEFLERIKV